LAEAHLRSTGATRVDAETRLRAEAAKREQEALRQRIAVEQAAYRVRALQYPGPGLSKSAKTREDRSRTPQAWRGHRCSRHRRRFVTAI